jgi:hypothetical protein
MLGDNEIHNRLIEEKGGNCLIGTYGSKWEDNIKIDNKEIGFTMLTEFRRLRIGSVAGFQVYFII